MNQNPKNELNAVHVRCVTAIFCVKYFYIVIISRKNVNLTTIIDIFTT